MTFDLNAKTCTIFVCHLALIQMKIEACFIEQTKKNSSRHRIIIYVNFSQFHSLKIVKSTNIRSKNMFHDIRILSTYECERCVFFLRFKMENL